MKHSVLCLLLLPALIFPGGCARHDDSYFPLGDHSWQEYTIERTAGDKKLVQRYIVANMPAIVSDDAVVYPRKIAGGVVEYYRITDWGIVLQHAKIQAESLIIPLPTEPGSRWQQKTRIQFVDIPKLNRPDIWNTVAPVNLQYSINQEKETVRVPAGIFENCIHVTATGLLEVDDNIKTFVGVRQIQVTQSEWYAPGVGLVKRVREELTSPALIRGSYTQELRSFRKG